MSRRAYLLVAAALALSACSSPPDPAGASAYLESIRSDPVRLEAFLRQMPKGGDLHTHGSGVPYAEMLLAWAVEDGRCMTADTFTVTICSPGQQTVASLIQDLTAYDRAVDAFSMRNGALDPPRYGHDHFFATFNLFGVATGGRTGDVFADAARRAQAEGTQYLELLHSLESSATGDLASQITWATELSANYLALLPGVRALVPAASSELDDAFARLRSLLRCAEAQADAACGVSIRVIQQVVRIRSPAAVFAGLILGAELALTDPRVVAVDLVAPEDADAALAHYRLHMQMIAFLRGKYPALRVALHAGELTAEFVAPQELTFHISEAVRVAGANRIGHGVDIRSETGWQDLLAEMARDRVPISIQLTSNAQILGVAGAAHPLHAYMEAGVPVVLSTDDQGVSRSNHTVEFVRAVTEQGLGWSSLKQFARNSLEVSFLPGPDLWDTPGHHARTVPACAADQPDGVTMSSSCQVFLRSSERAAEQWRLEARLAAFEARRWTR